MYSGFAARRASPRSRLNEDIMIYTIHLPLYPGPLLSLLLLLAPVFSHPDAGRTRLQNQLLIQSRAERHDAGRVGRRERHTRRSGWRLPPQVAVGGAMTGRGC